MIKRILLVLAALLGSLALSAQPFTGGVKGTVISRGDRSGVAGAALTLLKGSSEVAAATSDAEGNFLMEGLEDGMYELIVAADDFLRMTVNVTVNGGFVKNLFNLSLTPVAVVTDIDNDSFTEFDLDDSGYNDNPTILFGQNDVYSSVASFSFSSIRFRTRGYSSESQDVYLAGVKMNDALTGYSPYSLWTGLNEATRTKASVMGSEISDYGFGGYNGLTNIPANASNVRKGLRGSVLTNSALYRLRLMMTYSSGPLDNGWSYAFSASARLGGNDWINGVYYRSFAYYGSVEKQFDEANKLGLTFFATPGQRGAQNASTQEVYDLVGDNMYNSNWGYQDGKMRNARVRKTHEPVAILKYDFTPSLDFKLSATALYRFGKNGYTALDWYDAPDPRPDYYRNLPSYFYMENTDYNRQNLPKASWAREAWQQGLPEYTQINWDRLYSVNQLNKTESGTRSKYAQEERRVDQRDLNFALNAKWRLSDSFTLRGGASYKWNRTENYKIMADLLGGDYFLNVDQFAERDYAASPELIQNDLEYYRAHGEAQKIHVGEKYGYDYYAHIRRAGAWLAGTIDAGGFEGSLALRAGQEKFWREGLVQKGLFPNDSKGLSAVSSFLTYGLKTNLSYVFHGGHRVFADAAYLSDAPTFGQAFLSPRTRNTLISDLCNVTTLTGDLNYQYSNSGYDLRVTGFFTRITDQTDLMSFYDDLQNSFTNFAMSGIDEQHLGLELGFRVPMPVPNLSLQGVLSWGKYIYTSNPYMTQTVDNSAEVIYDHVLIPYWKSNPKLDGTTQQHYVPSTPQLASSLGLNWNKNYWFIDADVDYFAHSYLDMNPLYRTDMATAGTDGIATLEEIDYMASQEEFDPVFLVNASIGKSWYIHRKYQLGFSLQLKNLLNNTHVKTGGYEQTRLVDNTVGKERYYHFDPKYFYMSGFNYMLNIYFRF